MDAGDRPIRLLVVAGEPSGDTIGALLLDALNARAPRPVVCTGIGGPAMRQAGLEPLYDQSDLAVMGLVEVLPRLPRIASILRGTVAAAVAAPPDAVVTIDSSSFARRLVRGLRRAGIGVPAVHYVAPMVWAWRPGRARRTARDFDRLLTLFPFEPPLFRAHGLPTDWVGHPVVETPAGDGATFRGRHGIPTATRLLALLPGSRAGELDRLLPVFGAAAAHLRRVLPDLRLVAPTLPHLAARLARAWPEALLAVEPSARRDALAAADAAIAASGTVTLDLAAAAVPMVVGYRMAAPTAWLARRLLRVPYVALPNILAGAPVVPELLQADCTGEALAAAVLPLLADPVAAAAQRRGLAGVLDALCAGEERPSRRAAGIVLALATAEGTPQIDGEEPIHRRPR
ncbi:MAG: lipid-A-disaccharide synthase [Alphaproteobacteria bacterium]